MRAAKPPFIALTRTDNRTCLINLDNVLAVLPCTREYEEEFGDEGNGAKAVIYGSGGDFFPVAESVEQILFIILKRTEENYEQ